MTLTPEAREALLAETLQSVQEIATLARHGATDGDPRPDIGPDVMDLHHAGVLRLIAEMADAVQTLTVVVRSHGEVLA